MSGGDSHDSLTDHFMSIAIDNLALLQRWAEEMCQQGDLKKPAELNNAEGVLAWAQQQNIEEPQIYRALAKVTDFEFRDTISGETPSALFTEIYPIGLARDKSVLGLQMKGDTIPVAMGSYDSLQQLDTLSRVLNKELAPFFAPREKILAGINAAYEKRGSQTANTIESLDTSEALDSLVRSSGREDLLDSTGKSPVIRLVSSILFDAAQNRASDIHIQPYEDYLQVRFRIDGVLFDQFRIPKASQEEVLSRLKVIGEMNIAEKRLPQDGRASVRVGDRLIDLRVASLPTSFGERIVVRLLDKSARLYTLKELGMPPTILEAFRKLIRLEHGLILVTGPTGGGKSTTLYAGLQEINSNHSNVVTLEDPIEYQLEGISQVQISEKKGLTFAGGLRSVLRQDPDIIMVGEIRDRDTAEMAIQSALTGHMVFSTLHTNDAPSAVNRLLDLGIEPYLAASSLVGVLAQRLVRRICSNCKQPSPAERSSFQRLVGDDFAEAPQKLTVAMKGTGCDLCRNTGYLGRIGLFELMEVGEETQALIQQRASASQIRNLCRESGMKLLREDGISKILQGETTVEEVVRVSMQVE